MDEWVNYGGVVLLLFIFYFFAKKVYPLRWMECWVKRNPNETDYVVLAPVDKKCD